MGVVRIAEPKRIGAEQPLDLAEGGGERVDV